MQLLQWLNAVLGEFRVIFQCESVGRPLVSMIDEADLKVEVYKNTF